MNRTTDLLARRALMTERDAWDKICPIMSGPVQHTYHDGSPNEEYTLHENCIGSRCMAWRYADSSKGYCSFCVAVEADDD